MKPKAGNRRASVLVRAIRVAAVAGPVFTLAACIGLPGEWKTVSVDYTSEMTLKVSPRTKPASPNTRSDKTLTESGHVRVGTLSVTHIYKTCFPKKKGEGEQCSEKIHETDSATQLLTEAARNGADVAVFSGKNKNEIGDTSKEGKCISWSERHVSETVCPIGASSCYSRDSVERYCIYYEEIPGTKYSQESTAVLWRQDPELAKLSRLSEAMHAALVDGNVPEIERLIAAGMPVDRPDFRDRWPLSTAIAAKQYEAARALLAHGADPNENGGDALVVAAGRCNRPLMEALAARGAKLDPVSGEAIDRAVYKSCRVDFVAYLIGQTSGAGKTKTAVTEASAQDDPAVLRLLLANGAKPTKEALVAAAEKVKVEQARLLIEAGVSPNARHKKRKLYLVTYLVLETSRELTEVNTRRLEILRLLLEAGANPDKKGAYQYTALSWAVCYGQKLRAIELLLAHGASVRNKPVCKGGTLLGAVERFLGDPSNDSAKRVRLEKIRQILIEAGATS